MDNNGNIRRRLAFLTSPVIAACNLQSGPARRIFGDCTRCPQCWPDGRAHGPVSGQRIHGRKRLNTHGRQRVFSALLAARAAITLLLMGMASGLAFAAAFAIAQAQATESQSAFAAGSYHMPLGAVVSDSVAGREMPRPRIPMGDDELARIKVPPVPGAEGPVPRGKSMSK